MLSQRRDVLLDPDQAGGEAARSQIDLYQIPGAI
jgi:hypothetical protein